MVPVDKEMVVVKPTVGAQLHVHLVACALYVGAVVAVEKLVTPAIGFDAEIRELTPCGYRIERKRDGITVEGKAYEHHCQYEKSLEAHLNRYKNTKIRECCKIISARVDVLKILSKFAATITHHYGKEKEQSIQS